MAKKGEIYRIAGPVVTALGISPKMYDVVQVGRHQAGRTRSEHWNVTLC